MMRKIIGDFSTEVYLTVKEAKDICKLGQMEKCCAFLVLGKEFECIRMLSPVNQNIFNRLKNGTMNAKGRGGYKGCAWEKEISRKGK